MKVPVNMLPNRTPAQLLAIARQGLAEAAQTRPDGMRCAAAHLAALRAAAALLAARAEVGPKDGRPAISVWSLLADVAPEFAGWAEHFAQGSTKRAAAEAGLPRVVSAAEADGLMSAAEQFVSLVDASIGVAR